MALTVKEKQLMEENTFLDRDIYHYGRQLFADQYESAFGGRSDQEIDDELDAWFERNAEKMWPRSEGIHYSMDQPLFGCGWHPREIYKHLIWRWTGPENISFIYFNLSPEKKYNLAVNVAAWMTEILESVTVKKNGKICELKREKSKGFDGFMFRTEKPFFLGRPHGYLSRIEICTSECVTPNMLNSDNPDNRFLGVQIRDIFIEKVENL